MVVSGRKLDVEDVVPDVDGVVPGADGLQAGGREVRVVEADKLFEALVELVEG